MFLKNALRRISSVLPRWSHHGILHRMTERPLHNLSHVEQAFKAEIAERLRRMRTTPQPRKSWPEGCYGSALSWLLFVGPSPGGNPDEKHDLQRRKRSGGLCLWNQAFDIPYANKPGAWGRKYRENIPALVETIIGLPLNKGSAKLYGFANFDWVPSPQEGRVSAKRLLQGEADVLKVLKLTRPRIIAPTTTLAHERLLQCLGRAGYRFFLPAEQSVRIRIDPAGVSFHTNLDVLKLKGRGVLSGSVVVRLPQHPARMLYRKHGHRCARAIRQSLLQMYTETDRLVIHEV